MGQIDWSRSALEIKNQVRALQPWPRAFTAWCREGSEMVRLIVHRTDLRIEQPNSSVAPGTVVACDTALVVATGNGLLSLEQIQPAGKKMMQTADFLRGYPVQTGDRLR